MEIVIRGARLIDGVGSAPIEDGAVLISEGRIAKVARFAELDPPATARLVNLPAPTLAPGFIDVHSHATIETSGNEYAQADRHEAEVAIWAAHYLGLDLRAGVTMMRTLGDRKFVDLIFRQLQRGGYVKAPRLQAAGHLLQSSLVNVSVTEATADDIDSLRRYIRETARAGADWIKFYATPNSSAADPTLATYSKPEVDAIFFEARRINKPVSVHCHGGEAADWCIGHRVDSLEHGLYLEETQFKAMAENDIPLVPTTSVVLVKPDAGASPRLIETKARARSYLRQARRHGVRCIPGTDAVHGALASELLLMIDCGWSPMEAIKAATYEAARLLRLGNSLGALQAGKIADVIAIRGNPLTDPAMLRNVDLVIQDGKIAALDNQLTVDLLSGRTAA
jgi:imidazolonepropionase-like amidohydrolase